MSPLAPIKLSGVEITPCVRHTLSPVYFILFPITSDLFDMQCRDMQTNNACFICGIERHDFDKAVMHAGSNNGFSHHRDVTHNTLHYLYFVIHIWQQLPEDDNGVEMYVRRCLAAGDISWFPIGLLSESHSINLTKRGHEDSQETLLIKHDPTAAAVAASFHKKKSRGGDKGAHTEGFDIELTLQHMQKQLTRMAESQGSHAPNHNRRKSTEEVSLVSSLHAGTSSSADATSTLSSLSPHVEVHHTPTVRYRNSSTDPSHHNMEEISSKLGALMALMDSNVNGKLADLTSTLENVASRLDSLERSSKKRSSSPAKSRKPRSSDRPQDTQDSGPGHRIPGPPSTLIEITQSPTQIQVHNSSSHLHNEASNADV